MSANELAGTRASELRAKSDADLVEEAKSVARRLFQSRMKNFTNQLDNTAGLKAGRREIARVKTVLRERALAGQAQQATKGEAK